MGASGAPCVWPRRSPFTGVTTSTQSKKVVIDSSESSLRMRGAASAGGEWMPHTIGQTACRNPRWRMCLRRSLNYRGWFGSRLPRTLGRSRRYSRSMKSSALILSRVYLDRRRFIKLPFDHRGQFADYLASSLRRAAVAGSGREEEVESDSIPGSARLAARRNLRLPTNCTDILATCWSAKSRPFTHLHS